MRVLLAVLLLGACGSSGAPALPCEDACVEGAVRCTLDGAAFQSCVHGVDGCLTYVNAETCLPGASCNPATLACEDEPVLATRLADFALFVDKVESTSGTIFDLPIEQGRDQLMADLRAMLAADGSPRGHALAVRHLNLAFRDGHIAAFLTDTCDSPDHPLYFTSFQDACTQPYGDHVVVTKVGAANPLGLAPGDEILSWNGLQGAALEDAVVHAPLCASASASRSARRFLAGTSLLAVVQPGDTLGVRHLDGAEETITVGALQPVSIGCRNPTGTARAYVVQASWLDEAAGIALIDVPSLHPGTPGTAAQQLAALRQLFVNALADVPGAQARIWDLRGNTGGYPAMGLYLAEGLASVEPQALADCASRVPGSEPFEAGTTHDMDVVSQGFAFTGVDIVLTDGLTHSAGDWFAYAMKASAGSTAMLMGAPTSGAFGAGLLAGPVTPSSTLYQVVSPLRCTDLAGMPLEGRGVTPHVAVELEPADLAQGKDTVLERALTEARALLD
jgi:C-terminal processing protease CtpA/Prc